ncbi:MAG: hypothetical protein JHD16_13275 [Solirubrobacteraceae bacterium]|nr:hypothetical protein [Solirubrobacteraceae bacterium]
MPLRKQGTIIPSTALALVLSAAVLPSTASAAWNDWFAPKTTTTTTAPAPTPAPAPVATTPSPAPVATTPAPTSTAATTPAPAPVATTPPAAAPGCTPMPTTKAFSKFGDTADYYPAPGGSFESGTTAGWKFTTGAKVVTGNENIGVTKGSKSLQLSPGATATSPAFCVDETQPTFRFASKVSSLDGGYIAIVLWRDSEGKLTQSQFTASGMGTYWNGATAWNPSDVSPLAIKIPLSSGKTASVQLMFVGTMKAYGLFVGAKANIDSVMIDPYRRG